MSQFDLDSFLASPSLSLINCCRKDELAQIANHFSLIYPKQVLKRDLKALVVGKLVELGLIKVPVQTGSAVVEDGTLGEAAGSRPLEGDPPGNGGVEGASGEEDEREERPVTTPVTLPRYDPLSSTLSSTGSKGEARLKVRLARLQMESQEKAKTRQAELQYQLEVKRMEIEAEKAVRLRQLELESQRLTHVSGESAGLVSKSSSSTASLPGAFDVGKNVVLVPTFRETEVDSYFGAFERIAKALQWPPEVWALLLQCKINGKAQEAVAALPV